jgi:hypothetical protein
LAGPGTARKFNYEELQEIEPLRKGSSLIIVEEKEEISHVGYEGSHIRSLLAVMRLLVMVVLLVVGLVLIVTLSSYLMVFHSVKAEGIGSGSVIGEISRMKQYSDDINIYDIGNSYYPVAVKVER